MPGRNGQRHPHPTPITSAPLRFGAHGPDVQLGEDRYHLAIHTTAGARDIQEFINQSKIAPPLAEITDSLGTMLVNGALAFGNFDLLQGLLERALYDGASADLAMRSSPDQIIDCIDTLFEQSGLLWLARILKNSLTAMSQPLIKDIDRQLMAAQNDLELKLNELRQRENAITSTAKIEESSPISS